jgi:hypothetical protein
MMTRLAVGDTVRVRRGALAGRECVVEQLSGFAVFVRAPGGRVHVIAYPDLERVEVPADPPSRPVEGEP